MKYSGANKLTQLHGDEFYAEFDKQFGLKPVEVGQAVASNATSILGGQLVFNPHSRARPYVTGTESLFDDPTIIPSVPVDTFHSRLAGGLYKFRPHNMPATIHRKIQVFPNFSPVSPPHNEMGGRKW